MTEEDHLCCVPNAIFTQTDENGAEILNPELEI